MEFTTVRLVLINAMVCGLEVAATVAFTYLPPILLKAGFAESSMGIILGVGPLMGMFTVSAVGQLSDYWYEKFGQRIYFMLVLAFILSLSLLGVIFGHRLALTTEGLTIGCVLLAVGGVVLDYSSQVALNPCESLLCDLLKGSDCSERGFSIYSGVLSLGACVGYLLTAVHWPWGRQEESACGAALGFFLLCCATTMLAVSTLPSARAHPRRPRHLSWAKIDFPCKYKSLPHVVTTKLAATFLFIYQRILLLPVSVCREVWGSPVALWRLFVADTISWAACTSHALFYAHYVGQVVYAGHPNAAPDSLEEDLYNEGVRMGSWGLLLHSMSSCGYVLLLQNQLVQAYGLKSTYRFGLASFAACMMATLVVRNIWLLNVCAAFSGIGFAVMTSIPSALVTEYHADQQAYYFDLSADQKRGSGADFGVLYVGYYLGQTVISLVMSSVVQAIGYPHAYIAFAALASVLAHHQANKIVYSHADLPHLRATYNVLKC
ncbi:solute carrier family 45 member 3-like [Neocloeon triangulifer]|uniref:solute carrier family 45 member 3-like n=1 Tax=Neocloeon triangulifer TaxID=2078957 RepID=UPI00286EDF8A|nr:solute carrier family 45 member 3-like [Neocloeon triangulifer]